MGGYGSTRWAGHEKAATVEESLALDVADLVRLGLLLREPATVSRSVSWTVSAPAPMITMTRSASGAPVYSNKWYWRPVTAANRSMAFWTMSAHAR